MKPRNVIISIKPEYALKIVDGLKTIELRKRFPTHGMRGSTAIIYASSPLCKIIGYATIDVVKKLSVSYIWRKFGKQSCVTRDFFNAYFDGAGEGFALVLSNPVKLKKQLKITDLDVDCKFSPPQSYRYATEKLLRAIKT